jgi:hypothetical protein
VNSFDLYFHSCTKSEKQDLIEKSKNIVKNLADIIIQEDRVIIIYKNILGHYSDIRFHCFIYKDKADVLRNIRHSCNAHGCNKRGWNYRDGYFCTINTAIMKSLPKRLHRKCPDPLTT